MSVALTALVAVLLLVELSRLALVVRDARRPAIDRYVGHRLVVHTRDDGPSIRGVLLAPNRLEVRLADAEYLTDKGAQPLEGEQIIPRERLQFWQDLGAGEPA